MAEDLLKFDDLEKIDPNPDVSAEGTVPHAYPGCVKEDARHKGSRIGLQDDDNVNWKLADHSSNIVHRVALIGRTYTTSLHGEGHGKYADADLKTCPEWVDPGTRGCPIPYGAVLAGSSQRNNAMWLSIIDLCYEQDPDVPVQLRLPIIVHSLSMVYDDDTGVLTIAGGTGFGDDDQGPSTQIWQIKLLEAGSQWHQMPSLQSGIYEPVLFSNRGVLYIVGGYTQPNHQGATRKCWKLPIGENWEDIDDLPVPLKDSGHRGGVLWTDTNPAARVMIVITDDQAFHFDFLTEKWMTPVNHGKNLENCTPVLGPDGLVYVSLKYIDEGKEMFDVGTYDPKTQVLSYLKDQFFMKKYRHTFNPGYFLAPKL